MTTRDYEGRIAELEHALEDVLECFDDEGVETLIEVYDEHADGVEDAIMMAVGEDVSEIVATAREILYGGAAVAEEA